MKFLASILCFASLASPVCIAGELVCFERSYDAAHMRQHPGQSLQSIQVKTDFASFLSVTGVSSLDQKEYHFWGDLPLAGATEFCAGFTADGDQDIGCAKLSRSGETLALSPLAKKYNDGYQITQSKGITLLRCEGKSSDGEGCEEGKLRTRELAAANAEDGLYVLKQVACPAVP